MAPAPRMPRPVHRWLAALGCAALALLVVGVLHQRAMARLQHEVQQDTAYLLQQVEGLSSHSGVMGGVVLLGLVDPQIKSLLNRRIGADDPQLRATLLAVIAEYQADNALVLDATGRTVAYQAREGDSARALGRDLSVRPYFKRAVNGFASLYPAIGKNTGERGIYLAAPVRAAPDAAAPVAGVVVVKIGADRLDVLLGRYPHAALLVSPEGVVFGGNRSQWRLHTVGPVSPAVRETLLRDQQFGDLFVQAPAPVLALQFDRAGARLAHQRFSVGEGALAWPAQGGDWRLLVLRERLLADAWGLPLAGGTATLALSLALVRAWLRRRRRRMLRALERQAAAAALARELAFQQRLIDTLPNPLFLKDVQGRYTTLNRAFEQAYGVRREDFVGRTVLDVTAMEPDARDHAHAIDMELIQGGGHRHRSVQSHWADGQLHQLKFWGQSLADPDGTPAGMVGVLLDVSDEAAARAELRAREQQLRSLLESAPGAVIVTDDAGGVLFHNQHALEMFRIDAATLVGEGMRARYVDVADRNALFARLRRDGQVHAAEVEMLRGDGARFWAQISFSRGDFGAARNAAFGWSVDITARRQAAEAMRAARDAAEAATRAKSAFLANMSHEIRTPLNAIIGLVHLALQTRLSEVQRNHLQKAHHAGRTLMGIVNDILDFSRIEAGKLEIAQVGFDLDTLLADLAAQTGEKAGERQLELVFDIGPEVPRLVRGDPQRLGQVLANLLTNAVKFTERGEVVLRCRHRAQADGALVLTFSVRDTGIGMTDEQLGSGLFAPFSQADGSSTRRFGGTGLGLSICQRLVEAAGGHITVQSQLGEGSCFQFDWPCRIDADAAARPALPPALHGLRALVVDDHAGAGTVLAELLARLGLPAQSTADAHTVPARFGQAPPPGLLLLDPYLAGTDVPALLRSVKAARPDARVVLVAAQGDEALRRAAAQAGADAVLHKPVVEAALRELLASLVPGAGDDAAPALPAAEPSPAPLDAATRPSPWTDARAAPELARLCAMLEHMDSEATEQLQRLEPWLRQQLPPADLQTLWRHVRQYDLDEALALLRTAPALARWQADAPQDVERP